MEAQVEELKYVHKMQKWLLALMVIGMGLLINQSVQEVVAQEAEARSTDSKSIVIGLFTKPVPSEEITISEHDGEIFLNSSVLNCRQKVPSYELKSIAVKTEIDKSKYNIIISEGKYEYDLSELTKTISSDSIQHLNQEIVCDKKPLVIGTRIYFGGKFREGYGYDYRDSNFNISSGLTTDSKTGETTIIISCMSCSISILSITL